MNITGCDQKRKGGISIALLIAKYIDSHLPTVLLIAENELSLGEARDTQHR